MPFAAKIREVRLPMGLGRLAYSSDPGSAEMFSERHFYTNLSAVLISPTGKRSKVLDLGSGKVTNLGVLAMANDFRYAQVSGNPVNTLGACKWHAWGTGAGAEAKTSFELETYKKPTAATENAVSGTNSLIFQNEGKNQTLQSKATIKATEASAITEWGLHSTEAIKPAEKTLAASGQTATVLKGEAAAFTASGATTRGEQNKVAWVKESEGVTHELVGLVYESTTTELIVPGWVKSATEEKGENPKASAKYRVIPTLWDRKSFSVINLETNNEIEFLYKLEIVAGG